MNQTIQIADLWVVALLTLFVVGWAVWVALSLRQATPPEDLKERDSGIGVGQEGAQRAKEAVEDVSSVEGTSALEVTSAPIVKKPLEPVRKPVSLEEGLKKTRTGFVGRLARVLTGRVIDDNVMDELEEVLFTADLGVETATTLLEELREEVSSDAVGDPMALQGQLKKQLRKLLGAAPEPLSFNSDQPFVMMVVGVNGVGKTTTIGKLAQQLKAQGKKVIVAAADTFRAAAIEQIQIWGERAGVDVIAHTEGADPAAVAFDGAAAAKARGADVLIVDTAGRLHTKLGLMEELKKIYRVLGREIEGAPHEVLLVVDATTGQNALVQAKQFGEGVSISSIALTKLDGTAKGGIVVGIRAETGVPVRWIGVGEGIEDLKPFNPDTFVDALFVTP